MIRCTGFVSLFFCIFSSVNAYDKRDARDKFGCHFINGRYELSEDRNRDASLAYGKSIEPYVIRTRKELEDIVAEIKSINEDFIDTHPYNSVENLLSFFHYYTTSMGPHSELKDRSFANIYATYEPEFLELTPGFGVPLVLIDKITFEMKSVKLGTLRKHRFFAAVQNDITIEEINFYKKGNSYRKSEFGKKVDRVIVAIKFSLDNKIGHILVDPSAALINPIVLMEDGDENVAVTNFLGKKINYQMMKKNKNFITVKSASSQVENGSLALEQLIYVGKPFCAYLQIAEKRNLLDRDRYNVRLNRQGEISAGILFSMLPANVEQSNENICVKANHVKIFIIDESEGPAEIEIDFSTFKTAVHTAQCVDPDEMDLIKRVNKLLGYFGGDLSHRLQRIALMMNNNDFVESIYTYTNEVREKENKTISGNKPSFSQQFLYKTKNIMARVSSSAVKNTQKYRKLMCGKPKNN